MREDIEHHAGLVNNTAHTLPACTLRRQCFRSGSAFCSRYFSIIIDELAVNAQGVDECPLPTAHHLYLDKRVIQPKRHLHHLLWCTFNFGVTFRHNLKHQQGRRGARVADDSRYKNQNVGLRSSSVLLKFVQMINEQLRLIVEWFCGTQRTCALHTSTFNIRRTFYNIHLQHPNNGIFILSKSTFNIDQTP